jgi:hypothetical protein
MLYLGSLFIYNGAVNRVQVEHIRQLDNYSGVSFYSEPAGPSLRQ